MKYIFFKESDTSVFERLGNALTIILISLAATYFMYFSAIQCKQIIEFNKTVKDGFYLEYGKEVQEVSVYGIDLRMSNIGISSLLSKFNIYVKEKKITEMTESDIVYLKKEELVENFKELKENKFKFVSCYYINRNTPETCLFIKQKNGETTPYQEYVLHFLLKNKKDLPSIDIFMERLRSMNNIETITELNLDISKEDILNYNNFFSSNSRFLYKEIEKRSISIIEYGFHIIIILLSIFLLRNLIIYKSKSEDTVAKLVLMALFLALLYGFNPFF